MFIGAALPLLASAPDLQSKMASYHQLLVHIFQAHPREQYVLVFRCLFCRLLSSPFHDLPEETRISRLSFLVGFKIVESYQEGFSKPALNLKEFMDLLKGSLSS